MANFNYITDQGVIVPDTSTIRDEVVADWRSLFGQDLVVTPETPQGIFITQDTEIRDGVARNNAELANQINPDLAGGIWIDGIWALTNGKRRPATFSTLTGVELGGQPNTLVPSGSVAVVAATGERFLTTVPVIIGPLGTVTVDMRAEVTGPVAAPIGSLTQVASSVLGWETVNNPSAAVVGRVVESDIASRQRRRQTLALQSIAAPEAIISRLYDIDGVRSLTFRENITDTTQVIDGINIRYHSVWVCVEGGTNAEVAQALLETKTLGAGWTGAVTVPIVEPLSGQTYSVQFDRPVEVVRFARITVKPTPLDAQTIVKQAVLAYINGELDGEMGLVVGADISTFELAGAVNQVEPRIFVSKVELSADGITWSTNSVTIAINEVARISESSITVVVA